MTIADPLVWAAYLIPLLIILFGLYLVIRLAVSHALRDAGLGPGKSAPAGRPGTGRPLSDPSGPRSP